ncbi:MAG: helix-turn-helix transcriptional regulator [Solirubrobacterales bacterium]|nr:helix-turn-helix transcriptional regulator [Solirubrobacterales bacterium]
MAIGEITSHRAGDSRARKEQRVITALLMARVDALRRQRGLTCEQLAQRSGLAKSALDGMNERQASPSLITAVKICRGLEVAPGELLEDLPLPAEGRRAPSPK